MLKVTPIINRLLPALLLSAFAVSTQAKVAPVDLIIITAEQRELTQEVAKDYMYIGQHLFEQRARKSMEERLKRINGNQQAMRKTLKSDDMSSLLQFASMTLQEFKTSLESPYSAETATLVMDNSDVLLEIYDDIMSKLLDKNKGSSYQLFNKSKMQAVRVARIGKFYLAQKDGITDYNAKKQIENEVKAFEETMAELEHHKPNPKQADRGLHKVARLWSLVRKFFINVNTDDLPIVVDTSTNKLQEWVDKVANSYIAAHT